MRNFIVFTLLLCSGYLTAVLGQPCDSYTCDSLMVRAILDSNRMTTVKVKDVTLTAANGRVDALVFFKMPLKTIPDHVQRLTELVSLNVQNSPLNSISAGVTTLPKLVGIYLDSTRMCDVPGEITNWGASHNFKNTNPECSSPVITLIGASIIYVKRGEPFVDPGATATQKTDGDLTERITVTGVGSTETVNNFIVTYSVYDLAGGSNRITRTVKVVETSSIKPTITMLGKNPDTVFWKKPYTDPSATASDVVDGNLTGSIGTVSTVDISVPGKYSITYRVTNSYGNTVEAQRVVWVIDPSPRIFLKGLSQIILYQGNKYVEPEGSYASGYFTPGPIEIDTGSLNVHVPGDYVILYKVTDTEGYTAQSSRLVTIKRDSLAPVITLAGRNPLPWKKGVPFVDPGTTAADPENGNLTAIMEKLTSIDVNVTGVQLLKFRVSDPAGNVTEATRTVEIVVDTIPPRITLSGDSVFSMFQGTTYFEPGYQAYDTLWRIDYTSSVTVSGTLDRGKPGEYTLTYSVQDSAGNRAEKVRIVKVIADEHPPRLELKNDTVVALMVNGSFSEPGFSAYDEECQCDFASAVEISGTIDSSKTGDYVRTYTVKDSVGNTATARRTVVVSERPVIGIFQFNQVGYLPDAPKVVTFADRTVTSYRVLKLPDSSVVQEGSFPAADSVRKYVDLSTIDDPGTYVVNPEGLGYSPPVKIDDGVYDEILRASLKSYYYQRCSYELTNDYAGIWSRKAGHPDTALPILGSTGTRSVPGGWYDAGDYGKYIVNAGVSVGTLLNLYEAFPKRIGDYTEIPESKNGISDLLDEVRYELEWFLTMQDTDGGVFFKVGPLTWPSFIMPSEDVGQRYIIGKSTGSTLNFAAVMAMAARVWKEHDRLFADTCLSRSVRAYTWASSNKLVSAPGETGGTGDYYDSGYEDEFFWAGTELYLTTGNSDYKAKFNQYAWGTEYAHWQRVYCPAFYSLLTNSTSPADTGLIDTVIMVMKKNADLMVTKAAKSVYNAPIEEAWGSNGDIANKAVMLINLFKVTDDKKYLNAAYGILDYLLGKNSVGYSFVTGFGSRSPQHPHHRVSGSDGILAPVPGFVVGGPNGGYSDFQNLYNQNEVAINWNAPFVYLLAYFCKDQDVSTAVSGNNSSTLRRTADNVVGIRISGGRLRVEFAPGQNEKASIAVYSLSGRTVLKLDGIAIPKERHTIEVDVSHKLTSGIYMIDIRYGAVRKTVTINHCFH